MTFRYLFFLFKTRLVFNGDLHASLGLIDYRLFIVYVICSCIVYSFTDNGNLEL